MAKPYNGDLRDKTYKETERTIKEGREALERSIKEEQEKRDRVPAPTKIIIRLPSPQDPGN